MDIVALVQNFGLPVALTIFFVWQNKIAQDRTLQRLDSTLERLGNLESYCRGTLESIVRENTAVMSRLEKYLDKKDSQ